jgi:hypothetical protein
MIAGEIKTYIKSNNNFYNLREFLTVGVSTLKSGMESIQTTLGDFWIAYHKGKVYHA